MGMAGQGGEAPRAPGVKDEVVVGVVQGLDDGDEVGVAAVQPPDPSFLFNEIFPLCFYQLPRDRDPLCLASLSPRLPPPAISAKRH